MKCAFCGKEKAMVYDSIFTGAVCCDCYTNAKTTFNIANNRCKLREDYTQNKPYNVTWTACGFGGKPVVLFSKNYKRRGYAIKAMRRLTKKYLGV